ncbi:MAG: DUF547 domain-containing protein [Bacteriovoracaceae bacterium]|nr:DUF547 domain-containing protein [Bacteriovoracaceae bacterium]
MKLVGIYLCFLIFNSQLFAFDQTHKDFNEVLKKNVVFSNKQGLVKYKKLQLDPSKLDNYLIKLSSVSKKQFDQFSENEQLAFLINAYNAFTIKLIINNYPVKSIKDIGSFFKSSWKIKFFTLLGEKTYLDHIEHDLIRKQFNEPRIHFALNCASISCPSLQNFAYTAKQLEVQLVKVTQNFLKNTGKNRFVKKDKKLQLSKIFKWYKQDFVKKHGSVMKFVRPYFGSDVSDSVEIEYLDYDWKLNE